jgi:hypothetical protein
MQLDGNYQKSIGTDLMELESPFLVANFQF